jgi:hypothetical protein
VHPDDEAVIDAAKNKIAELKTLIPGISIMDENGIVSIGEKDAPCLDYIGEPFFFGKEKNVYFQRYYCPIRKKDFFAAVGPIYDSLQPKKIIGAIAFDIGFDYINELMKESIDCPVGDESYLIDRDGMMLTESEYVAENNSHGVLIQQVKSASAQDCLGDYEKFTVSDNDGNSVEEHSEKVFLYVNYMGDTVLGAHGYVPSIKGGVISEIKYARNSDDEAADED